MKVKLSTIRSHPDNPRVIKDSDYQSLKKSIILFPEMQTARPMVVNSSNQIIGGNQRRRAFQDIAGMSLDEISAVIGTSTTPIEPERVTFLIEFWDNFKTEKTVEVHKVDWSEAKQKEFMIKDNVSNGEWDYDVLANDWNSLELNDWGVGVWEQEEPEKLEAKEDDYEEPETVQTDIVLGDLVTFEKDGKEIHRLLCGDSTDSEQVAKLMNGEKANMVFTSPPYNGNTTLGFIKSDGTGTKDNKPLYQDNSSDNKTAQEYIQFNTDIFNTIKTIASDELVLLYNINYNRNSPDLFIDVVNSGRQIFNLVETIIWEKSMAISLAGDNLTRIFEFIFVFYNGLDKPRMNKLNTNECIKNLWKVSNIGANNEIHKACFPVKLAEQAINVYAKTNAILYEPFTGSGSTMVAAHQLNRKCYGMELEPKYCQVIIDRMQKLDSDLVVKINGSEHNQ